MQNPCFYRISVKGIVVDSDGRVLLTKEKSGKWELLGGGLEHGEQILDGLQREINEESGLKVTSVSAQPKYFITFMRDAGDFYMANAIYEITLKDLDITPSDECVELRFFTPEEAHREKLYASTIEFLKVFNPANHNLNDLVDLWGLGKRNATFI